MTEKLPPGVEAFGERLEEAVAREVAERPLERRRRRRAHRLALPVATALAAAAASAGAVRIVDRAGEPIEPEPESPSSLQPAADPAVVVASATPDPGGGPPWVVRAYTTTDGRACVQVGRLRDGAFGQVQNGRFRALPRSAQATCAPSGEGAVVAVQRHASVNLTLVFGLGVDRSPVTVEYGDVRRRVDPVVLGAFVTVFAGADPRQQVVIRSKVAGKDDVQRR